MYLLLLEKRRGSLIAACGAVIVSVVPGETPTFVLRAEDTIVNPNEKTVVRGKWISTHLRDIEVWLLKRDQV